MADAPPQDEPPQRRTIIGGVREAYLRVPAPRRRLIVIVGAAVLLGLVAMVVMAGSKEPWRPVARDLAPEDLDAATKAFDDKKIPYKLGDESSILVPPEQIHEARLALAVNAMPSGKSVGFELFDTSAMGRSAFTERVNLHRALEGELARTIKYIDGIEKVRVHLVTPERRVFKELDAAPSASVVVTLAAGAEMTRDKAMAIRQLVSGAVERLTPGRVSIVDQHGRMLTPGDGEDGLAMSDAFERQGEQERALEDRVVRLLEPMIGEQKVLVRVALDLDSSRVTETREDFDPNQQVVRSEREQIDKSDSASATPAGPPGTASNLPGGQNGSRGGANAGLAREKSDTIRNYEVDKVTTHKESPLPRVRKMSVAVLVDDLTEVKDGKPVTRPRTADELAQLSRLASHAVGLDVARGDQIEVTSAPFAAIDGIGGAGGDGEVAGDGEGAPGEVPLWQQPIVLIAAGGGLLLLILGMALWLRARSKKKARALELAVATTAPLATVPEEPQEIPEVVREQLAAERRARITELRERALALGNEDLHRLAGVFQHWLEPTEGESAVAAEAPKKAAA